LLDGNKLEKKEEKRQKIYSAVEDLAPAFIAATVAAALG